MADSFFFYDLETSGFNPRSARIMQFAGQRTNAELEPIGEPVNILIRMTPDVLPEPDAILVTGITPQQTQADGMTEAEFLRYFYDEIVQPNTTFMGFNSIRFDDEFMRFLHWRNYYDAYEWQWANGCSRWDLLDVVRMTRALKPAGIEWPFAPDGRPANRLEFLTKVNKLDHYKAHDALSDVYATIAVARLIRDAQPELFSWLLTHRSKQTVIPIVSSDKPFMYTSGKYPSQTLHTTAAVRLCDAPLAGNYLVYDLRYDPTPFLQLSVDEIVAAWRYSKDPDALRLPVKTLKANHCPAIVPGVVQDADTLARLELSVETVQNNLSVLLQHKQAFAERVLEALQRMDVAREQVGLIDDQHTVDARLYDGFVGGADKQTMQSVRHAAASELSNFADRFKDDRLRSLLPLYKARNYPRDLTGDERAEWEAFCKRQLFDGGDSSRLAKFFARLGELAETNKGGNAQFLLEELQLYGQSIIPDDVVG